MKIVTLKSLLMSIADLGGVQYDRQLSPAQVAMLTRLASEHLTAAWQEYPWPELCSTDRYYLWPDEFGPLTGQNPGDVVRLTRGETTTYWQRVNTDLVGSTALGATVGASAEWGTGQAILLPTATASIVQVNDQLTRAASITYYRVTQVIAGTTNTTIVLETDETFSSGINFSLPSPAATTSTAFEPADIESYITLTSTIGEVLEAWDADPLKGTGASRIPYRLEGDKIRIPHACVEAWLETKDAPPTLNPTTWAATESATVGMVRYYETSETGNCYLCIKAKTGNAGNAAPLADAETWQLVQIPALLAPIVKYAASADRLRADGKESTAIARERNADAALERAMNSVNSHQHQNARYNVAA